MIYFVAPVGKLSWTIILCTSRFFHTTLHLTNCSIHKKYNWKMLVGVSGVFCERGYKVT